MTPPTPDETRVSLEFSPDRVRVIPGEDRSSKVAVITHIARTLAEAYPRPNPDEWASRIRHRETLCSTGIGGHFALVHDFQPPGEVVGTANPDFDLWLFLLPTGTDWEALDGKPVHVLACPVFRQVDERGAYLRTLWMVQERWAGVTAAENLSLSAMSAEEAARWLNTCSFRRTEVGA